MCNDEFPVSTLKNLEVFRRFNCYQCIAIITEVFSSVMLCFDIILGKVLKNLIRVSIPPGNY